MNTTINEGTKKVTVETLLNKARKMILAEAEATPSEPKLAWWQVAEERFERERELEHRSFANDYKTRYLDKRYYG